MNTPYLLADFLAAAVPLHIMELERQGGPTEADFRRVKKVGQDLAAYGDALLYRQEGKTAELANRLAKAVAVMAFVDGGITILGNHFEAKCKRF